MLKCWSILVDLIRNGVCPLISGMNWSDWWGVYRRERSTQEDLKFHLFWVTEDFKALGTMKKFILSLKQNKPCTFNETRSSSMKIHRNWSKRGSWTTPKQERISICPSRATDSLVSLLNKLYWLWNSALSDDRERSQYPQTTLSQAYRWQVRRLTRTKILVRTFAGHRATSLSNVHGDEYRLVFILEWFCLNFFSISNRYLSISETDVPISSFIPSLRQRVPPNPKELYIHFEFVDSTEVLSCWMNTVAAPRSVPIACDASSKMNHHKPIE